MADFQTLFLQQEELSRQLREINSKLKIIQQFRDDEERRVHCEKSGHAIVDGWYYSGIYILKISSTTVPIRPGDWFRVGKGYGNCVQVIAVKTHRGDIIETEIPINRIGLGELYISQPSKEILSGDILTKITLTPE
jgi:hypothetical protein